jgi:hypothetical protein
MLDHARSGRPTFETVGEGKLVMIGQSFRLSRQTEKVANGLLYLRSYPLS